MLDKLKKRRKPDLAGIYTDAFAYCCGLQIVYNLYDSSYGGGQLSSVSRDLASVAVTAPSQKKAVKALKAHGFKAVGTFKSSHGYKCTLWLRDAK